jgi:Transcription antiterminator
MIEDKKWVALYTKPRSEFKAEADINKVGIINYLPVVTRVKQWSDRKKKVTEPVLNGYIFIFADERERLAALEVYSVVRCVFDNGKPAVIPEWQIDNLKKFLSEQTEYLINNGLTQGTKIKIKSGPFEGVIGVIISDEKKKSLSVNLDLLNRSITAEISADTEFEVIK